MHWWHSSSEKFYFHSFRLEAASERAIFMASLEPLEELPSTCPGPGPRAPDVFFCPHRPCTWCTEPSRRSLCPPSCPHPSSRPPRGRRQCSRVLCLSCPPAPHQKTASAPRLPTAASAASTALEACLPSTASSKHRYSPLRAGHASEQLLVLPRGVPERGRSGVSRLWPERGKVWD